MFCGKCGKEISDGSAFCKYCGTVVGNRDNKNNKNKTIGIVTTIVIAVIAVGIVTTIYGKVFGTGYKHVIKQYLKAIQNEDAELLYELYPDYCNKYMLNSWDSDRDDYNEFLEEKLSSDRAYFEQKLGEKFSLDYEINEAKKLTSKELENKQDMLREEYDCKDLKLQEAYYVDYKIIAKSGDKSKWRGMKQSFVKIDSKWYVGVGFNIGED